MLWHGHALTCSPNPANQLPDHRTCNLRMDESASQVIVESASPAQLRQLCLGLMKGRKRGSSEVKSSPAKSVKDSVGCKKPRPPIQPAEKPHDSEPAEKPHDSEPVEKPHDSKPAEKPNDSKPAEKPHDSKPAEKPHDSKPAEKPHEPDELEKELEDHLDEEARREARREEQAASDDAWYEANYGEDAEEEEQEENDEPEPQDPYAHACASTHKKEWMAMGRRMEAPDAKLKWPEVFKLWDSGRDATC